MPLTEYEAKQLMEQVSDELGRAAGTVVRLISDFKADDPNAYPFERQIFSAIDDDPKVEEARRDCGVRDVIVLPRSRVDFDSDGSLNEGWTTRVTETIDRKLADGFSPKSLVSVDLEWGRILTARQVAELIMLCEFIKTSYPEMIVGLYGHPSNTDDDMFERSFEAARPLYESEQVDVLLLSAYAGRGDTDDLERERRWFDRRLERGMWVEKETGKPVIYFIGTRYRHDHPVLGTKLLPATELLYRVEQIFRHGRSVALWSPDRTWTRVTTGEGGEAAMTKRPMKFGRFHDERVSEMRVLGLNPDSSNDIESWLTTTSMGVYGVVMIEREKSGTLQRLIGSGA